MGCKSVRALWVFLLMLCMNEVCFCLPTANLPPQVTIRVPPEEAVEGREFSLYITVVHSPNQKVDSSLFTLDDAPLKVSAVQEEKVAPKGLFKDGDPEALIVSRFIAKMPSRKAGVYEIGPVMVAVGGIKYSSGTTTMNIQGAVVSPLFRLETKVISPPKIFPGEELQFEYQIHFTRPMQLLREELPLLDLQGFMNIGSPQVTIERETAGNIEHIVQRVIAPSAGRYEVPSSVIEGMAVVGTEENKQLVPPLLRAEASPLSIVVYPFPEQGRPQEFDGALGTFVWRAFITEGSATSGLAARGVVSSGGTPAGNVVAVGEKVQVEYRVSGRGALSSVKFPAFHRLSGLTEAFWVEASPPAGVVQEGTKVFVLVLRPKSAGHMEIPGFTFASFDPFSQRYITTPVPSVSLIVTGAEEEIQPRQEPVPGTVLLPLFELSPSTITARTVSWWIVACAGITFVVVGMLQVWLARRARAQEKSVSARSLFYQALTQRSKRDVSLRLLKRALFLRVYEVGLTSVIGETPDDLPSEGLVGDVRQLLILIDKELYHHMTSGSSLKEIYDEATSLYHRLRQLAESQGGV